MRELLYTDPFMKVLKNAILQRIEQMAAAARLQRHRQAVEAEQGRHARRQAIERSLLEVSILSYAMDIYMDMYLLREPDGLA